MTAPGTMPLAELQRLVAESLGEWEHVEFEKSTGELHGGMETLCGFLNGGGGKVFFGVTNAGRVVGQDVADATFQEVANFIRKLGPPVLIDQTRVVVAGAKEVLILETTTHANGPYAFDDRPFLRIGNTTSRMPQPEYERRILTRSNSLNRWESHVADGYTLGDLDIDEVERAVRVAVEKGRLDATLTSPGDALDRLHLRVGGLLLRAAVVLFGRRLHPDYPQCSLRMA